MNVSKSSKSVAVAAGLALALTACGGDDESTASGSASEGATAEATPAAEIASLSGRDTAVALDPGFLEGLTTLQLTPGMIGTGKLENGSVIFPITGGNVTYFDPASGVEPYVQGLVEHEGSGLSLTGGGKTVKLENFEVDPEASVLYGKVTVDDQVFAERADLFFLDGRTLNPLRPGDEAGTAVLQGTTVSLTKTAADALNMVFGTDALAEFFKVGVATITVNTGA